MNNIFFIYLFSFIFGILETILYTFSLVLIFSPNTINNTKFIPQNLYFILNVNPFLLISIIFILRAFYTYFNSSYISFIQSFYELKAFKFYSLNYNNNNQKSSDLVKNIINDIGDFIYLRVIPTNSIMLAFGAVIPFLFLLYLESPIYLLKLLISFVLLIIIYLLSIRKILTNLGKIIANSKERKINLINAVARNFNIVKHYNYFAPTFSKYRHLVRIFKYAFKNINFLTTVVRPTLEFIFMIVIISIFSITDSENLLTIDGILIASILRIMPAFYTLFTNINFIFVGTEANYTFKRISDSDINFVNSKNLNSGNFSGEFNLKIKVPKNKRFNFDVENFTDEFNRAQGQFIVITGESGKGKSSLVESIVGLNEIDVKLYHSKREKIHKDQIGYCPQSSTMICNTVDAEIIYGRSIDLDWMNLLKATLDIGKDFPPVKINGLDNPNISGGQLQRLALARALYYKPKLLVLDEATNAISPLMERKILKSIRNYLPNTYLIAIMHRLENEDLFDVKIKL